MHIASLEVYSYPAPFRAVFRHASASRSRTENLIVAARSADGLTGYGEGCPRSYVTGETAESAAAFVRKHAPAVADAARDEPGLRAWAEAHRSEIDEHPAAFCAVELAVLDLLGKTAGVPIEDVLGLPRLAGAFAYSAVLGDAPYPAYWWQFRRYRRRGFTDFKVKVSGDLGRDRRKMRLFMGGGLLGGGGERGLRLRLDANNLWGGADDCIRHLAAIGGAPFAVEEPLRAGDLAGFERVSEELGVRIILDESLLRAAQLDGLGAPGAPRPSPAQRERGAGEIPAYAGMTGQGGEVPAYAGMTRQGGEVPAYAGKAGKHAGTEVGRAGTMAQRGRDSRLRGNDGKVRGDDGRLRGDDGANVSGKWIANVRVSKMGGVRRSLEVVEKAAELGIGVIVGAQVGETSILTRAGLSVMQAAGSALAASEGAFGTHLLREDLTSESLTFGDGGLLAPGAVAAAPGLGLAVREDALRAVA